ncbi:spindle and kinetochore-associated protein 3-like [Haliotis asinina]|uniref:spindle and kinetochore-associated protein 3-like n=1 Tax=Haliotis asinina TaxID=109174 RepID=UPI003531BA2B
MESTSVFCQLRSLARRLDQGVADIQKKVADPRKRSDSSYAHAYKHLQEVKKDIHALKEEAQEKLACQQISTHRLQQVLDLLPRLIESQRRTLTGTEDYLEQYGYVKQVKKTIPTDAVVKPEVSVIVHDNNDEEGDGSIKEEPDAVNDEAIVHETASCTPPTRTKPSECKTPRLEDFGLSDFTLSILQKGRSCVPTQHVTQPSSLYVPHQGLSEDSPTPALFKHNGLLVTPSLMGGRYIPQQTPDCNRMGCDLPQPMFTEDSPAPFLTPADKVAWRRPDVRPNYDTQGSPVPPVLNTPGAKQINKQLYRETVKKPAFTEDNDSPIPPLLMTPGMKQISKTITVPQVSSTLNNKPDNDSPVVPVLMTPGVKQIQKSVTDMKAPSVPVPASSWDKEPEMPEFTLSLQDITQLTQSFRLNNSTSCMNPPEAPTLLGKQIKDRDTPPLPELLSTRLANLGTMPGMSTVSSVPNTKAGDDTMSARILKATQCDTPPPPTLFGKYNFTSKYEHRENIPPQ